MTGHSRCQTRSIPTRDPPTPPILLLTRTRAAHPLDRAVWSLGPDLRLRLGPLPYFHSFRHSILLPRPRPNPPAHSIPVSTLKKRHLSSRTRVMPNITTSMGMSTSMTTSTIHYSTSSKTRAQSQQSCHRRPQKQEQTAHQRASTKNRTDMQNNKLQAIPLSPIIASSIRINTILINI
jgi:hypothetical protein